MAIGRHECHIACDTDLKGALTTGLDEALTALEECFYDLSDAQAWAFPIPEKNNIAWIVMHCLQNIDGYANDLAGGAKAHPALAQERWNLWQSAEDQKPKPGDDFPTVAEMLRILSAVRQVAMPTLEKLDDAALMRKTINHPLKHSLADFYMRAILHAMSHIRQVWLLRGALGLADGPWPKQHWA